MKTILLSLHPKWWEKMLSGEKLIEVRKTAPSNTYEDYRVLIYVTGGVGVVGEFICNHFWRMKLNPSRSAMKEAFSWDIAAQACLTWDEIYEYGGGAGRLLWGWQVTHLKAYDKPKSLSEYGLTRPPQSWRYLR